ncbi:hypothetical protein BKA70DRAFT_1423333 [Coprinopsis sp. MPI-PUGE-AT-0042]|nr:hypothetical protein BKA70DRAFT_1423333 [Coprinopsis sp. MPI-PUGE-AT-0042]
MEFVRDRKDRPGLTNIEANFYNALQDCIPTLTELAIHALYNVLILKPFMQHVRIHSNILGLGSFFADKMDLMDQVISNPKLWIGNDALYSQAVLGGRDSGCWEETMFDIVIDLALSLPHLEELLVAFLHGARATFACFTNEFAEGGDIATLTDAQWDNLFLALTNDMNEGGLGQMRVGKRRRPNETLHKFNATYKSKINQTRTFIETHLSAHEDWVYLRKTAQAKTGKIRKELKRWQIEADAAKVACARQFKCRAMLKKKQQQKAEIRETSRHLVLDDEEIDKLTIAQLDKQLNFHHANERALVPALQSTLPPPLRGVQSLYRSWLEQILYKLSTDSLQTLYRFSTDSLQTLY